MRLLIAICAFHCGPYAPGARFDFRPIGPLSYSGDLIPVSVAPGWRVPSA